MGILEVNVSLLLIVFSASGEDSVAPTVGIARRPSNNSVTVMSKHMAAGLVKKEVPLPSDQDFVNPRLFLGFDTGEVTMW